MPASQPQVFISYQRSDELFARQLRAHLVAAGVGAWMDQFDIPVGDYWPDAIDRGLAGSDIVVGLLSPDAVASRNVKNEWDWALAREKPLLLLMTRPTEIPHRYVSINFIDATIDQRRALDTLLLTLGVSSDGMPAVESTPPAPTRHGATTPARRYLTPPVLVGREREQAQLHGWLEHALAGQGGLALIGGEAGIGKTTLTSWLLWAAEERGALALTGACYDLATTPPYGPWVEILRDWPAGGGLPPVPAELRDAVALEAVQSQAALFDLVARFLSASSAARPLVLQLEDLHWIDQASLDLLRFLTRQLPARPVLVVATYRSDELHRRHPLYAAIPALLRDGDGRQLELRRLDDDAVLRIARERYHLPEADERRLAEYVQRRAEGNALYVRELLLTIEEAGLLTRAGDDWSLGDLNRAGLPTLIRQVIDERLARLGAEAHAALAIAAVIGHEAPLDAWSEVSERPEDALLDVIDRAVEARVLSAAPDGLSVSFAHALIREALYEGVTPTRRRVWHRRVAEALLARPRPDPDALAWHFQQASDPRATDWLIQAGERAQRAAAWTIAAERFVAALPGLEADPARDLQRAKLMYRIGRLLRFHDSRRSRSFTEEARELALASGDGRLAAHARFSAGQAIALLGDWASGLSEMEAAVAEWDAADAAMADSTGQNPDLGGLAMYLGIWGRLRDAAECAERFLAGGPVRDNSDDVASTSEADALLGLGIVRATMGLPEQALPVLRDAHARYDAAGHLLRSGASRSIELGILVVPFQTDNLDRRASVFEEARDWFFRGRAAGQGSGYPMGSLADMCWLSGEWDAPELLPMTSGMVGSVLTPAHVHVLWRRGDAEGAWKWVQERFPAGSDTPTPILMHQQYAKAAMLTIAMCVETGDAERALPWLRKFDEILEMRGGVLWQAERQLLWARYHFLTGDCDAAQTSADAALARASQPRQPYALLQAHRFLGQLATAIGNFDNAEQRLAESLALADACAFPFERALTLAELAELQFARDDEPGAARTLAGIRAICEPLRAQQMLDRVADLEARMAAG
jgi:hypothetical protein